MDDFYSVEKFRRAGATTNLTKESAVVQMIEEVKQQYHIEHASRTSLHGYNRPVI